MTMKPGSGGLHSAWLFQVMGAHANTCTGSLITCAASGTGSHTMSRSTGATWRPITRRFSVSSATSPRSTPIGSVDTTECPSCCLAEARYAGAHCPRASEEASGDLRTRAGSPPVQPGLVRALTRVLPVVDVQDILQRKARGGTERLARVVGGRDERALPDVAGQAEEVGHLL